LSTFFSISQHISAVLSISQHISAYLSSSQQFSAVLSKQIASTIIYKCQVKKIKKEAPTCKPKKQVRALAILPNREEGKNSPILN
jgi:hypothetical protein